MRLSGLCFQPLNVVFGKFGIIGWNWLSGEWDWGTWLISRLLRAGRRSEDKSADCGNNER
ncbi:MAG: hypothetical protein DMG88_13055 [Acidobacteria bacterium]|nr:MAG: hypothetical protein DMG88_13055 [Acidobacteriota bacterium]